MLHGFGAYFHGRFLFSVAVDVSVVLAVAVAVPLDIALAVANKKPITERL